MLIHENLSQRFYHKILKASSQTSRVLIIASLDVDALCSSKILSELFNCDNVLYTIKPVVSDLQLYETYHRHRAEHNFVIFLNCGGNLDLTEALLENDNEEDDLDHHEIEIFILDSRRPLDLVNVYTEKPISVILKEEDDISLDFDFIPKLEEIYRDEDEDDNFGLDSDEESNGFDKAEWLGRREKVLTNYARFSFFSTSVTFTLFDMALGMSKDTNELLERLRE